MRYYLIIVLFFYTTSILSCSIFDTTTIDNKILVGRNFDWTKQPSQINFIPANKTDNGVVLFSSNNIDMPYDGMNDKGMFVAISAVPNSETTVNILKPIRKSLEFVKVILQKASTIDEAIKQFDKYSIAFGQFLGNPLIHFKIVDKLGNTVIVEFIDNKMVILRDDMARVMTNHYVSNISIKSNSKTSIKRFNALKNKYYNNIEDTFNSLDKVKQNDTLWSNVYDLTNQIVYVRYLNREIVKFNLKDELYKYKKAFYYDMETINSDKTVSYIKSKSDLKVRPHFGFGNHNTKHYGLRVLLGTNEKQSYGLELTKFKMNNDEFKAIGIVLEQRLWEWFNMSIGTVGYFDYGIDNQDEIGIVSNLGWEPNNHIPFNPFVTFRNDTIFTKDKTKRLNSLSFGMRMEF